MYSFGRRRVRGSLGEPGGFLIVAGRVMRRLKGWDFSILSGWRDWPKTCLRRSKIDH